MLPFLKSKEGGSQEPVDHQMREPDDGEYDAIDSAAEDLISAIHSKNIKGVAEALKAAFELCDSEPHVEGEHLNGD